jgi:hypothetical protein
MFTLGVYEPGAGFDWHGSLDAMVWYGEKPKPTADELAAVWESSGRAEYAAARNAVAAERRAPAYRDEADPLFFKWQRGESTEQDWLDAVAAIRERFPYES